MTTPPPSYAQKHVAVFGLGRSGESAARLLRSLGASCTLLDSASATGPIASRADALRSAGFHVICGAEADNDATVYDLGVTSPGIDASWPILANFLAKPGHRLVGELELAASLTTCPLIAITGTNGKTTTTELTTAMLAGAGLNTAAVGNIGTPLSDLCLDSSAQDWLVVEVSSFQLETIETFRPRVAVWTNFTPDHLDRYPTLDAYRQAKERVFENQHAEDWAIVNAADAASLPIRAGNVLTFSATTADADLTFSSQDNCLRFRGHSILSLTETRLRGRHNAENLLCALGVAYAAGVPWDTATPALRAYAPAPHRCELVATISGVDYVNDSKGTNPDAVAQALTIDERRPVVLIAGGKDKGFAYDPLTPLVARRCRAAVLIGEMAKQIAGLWESEIPCSFAQDMPAAVRAARELAHPGDTVLLSPGTSSFDMFTSYADRGEQFRRAVQAIEAEIMNDE